MRSILRAVNVLVHAHPDDAVDHAAYLEWLERIVNGDKAGRDYSRSNGLRWRYPLR